MYVFALYKNIIKYNNIIIVSWEKNYCKSITAENEPFGLRKNQNMFVFLLPIDQWWEKCALGKREKVLTKPNRYHAKDCSVIMGLCDSPFPGNASHRLKWLHVFQGKTRLALSRSLKIEKASNVIRVCTRILGIKYICNRSYDFPRTHKELQFFITACFANRCVLRRRKKERLYVNEKVFIHILCVVVKTPYTLLPEIFFLMARQEMSLSLVEQFEKCKCAVLRLGRVYLDC